MRRPRKADEVTSGDSTDEGAATWESSDVSTDGAPSTSGTSEGADLSTPNLDAGSNDKS